MEQGQVKTKKTKVTQVKKDFEDALACMNIGLVMQAVEEDSVFLYKLNKDKQLMFKYETDEDVNLPMDEWEWAECAQTYNEISVMEFTAYIRKNTYHFSIVEFQKYLETILGPDFDNKKALYNRIKRITDVLDNYKK